MPNHTHNWQVKYTLTSPEGARITAIAFARTREDARTKALIQHADSPHGWTVRTQRPVKVPTV